jgi:hypothetical protein
MLNVSESQADADSSHVEREARQLYRMVVDGIENIGGIEIAAGIVGLNRGDVRRCVDRDGRRLAVEHAMSLGARLRIYNPQLATKIAAAFVAPFDLCVFPRVTLTDKERADRLESLVRRMPLGEQLLADALGDRSR